MPPLVQTIPIILPTDAVESLLESDEECMMRRSIFRTMIYVISAGSSKADTNLLYMINFRDIFLPLIRNLRRASLFGISTIIPLVHLLEKVLYSQDLRMSVRSNFGKTTGSTLGISAETSSNPADLFRLSISLFYFLVQHKNQFHFVAIDVLLRFS